MVGGASSGLVVHNSADTVITRLASTIYWCELYLSRSLPGSVGKSDCQSGPSAAFRLSAIRPILVPWYNQRVFGKKMVRNSFYHTQGKTMTRKFANLFLPLPDYQRRSTSHNPPVAPRMGHCLCRRCDDRNGDADNGGTLDPPAGEPRLCRTGMSSRVEVVADKLLLLI